jgi:hypothetical protein
MALKADASAGKMKAWTEDLNTIIKIYAQCATGKWQIGATQRRAPASPSDEAIS